MLRGIGIILFIAILAGVIAYIGDRVGHQVGRKRLTLFNLRPKYTSTVVAVRTGMMIALAVIVTALLASQYARAAFFHLEEINNQVNALKKEEDDLNKRVRESNVVVNRRDLMYDEFLRITPGMSASEKLKDVSAFFDAVVQSVNRRYALQPEGVPELKPVELRSSDPDVRAKLVGLLNDPRAQSFLLQGPMLVLAVADQNLFVNDQIHFALEPYADHLIFRSHQAIDNVEVDGGTELEPRIVLSQLSDTAQNRAIEFGMPAPFARALTTLGEAQVQQMADTLRRGRGRFYVIVRAASDVYP